MCPAMKRLYASKLECMALPCGNVPCHEKALRAHAGVHGIALWVLCPATKRLYMPMLECSKPGCIRNRSSLRILAELIVTKYAGLFLE